MNNLENLVPPLELCQQIPEGAFSDSALVWWGMCVYPRRHPDGARYGEPYRRPGSCPAPTLAEILEVLPTIQYSTEGMDFYLMLCDYRNKHTGWGIGYGRMSHGAFKGLVKACKGDTNPATAALNLWFAINDEARKTKARGQK